jgi:hypothetical protein
MTSILRLILILVISFVSLPSFAKPQEVSFGAFINDIYALDIKSGTAEVDVDLWVLSDSQTDWLNRLEVKNGLIEERSAEVKKLINGKYYISERLKIKLTQDFNLSRFPVDTQRVSLFFQDSFLGRDDLVFVPDAKNSRCSSELSIHGWNIGDLEIFEKPRVYKTNFGDTSLGSKKHEFSRIVVACPMERDGYGYFLKLFSTIFLAAFVAYLGFFINPEDLDPRFGLGIGGIFAVMASNFVLTAMLPETGEVTFIEATLFASIAMIFIYLAESVWVLKLCKKGMHEKAKRIDNLSALISLIIYILSFVAIIWHYFY